MRRIAALITLLAVASIVLVTPGRADATWEPVDQLHLDIIGVQPMFRQETPGGTYTSRFPAGFIGSPGNKPQRFGDPPSTKWIKRIENKDLIAHNLWQCAGDFHGTSCTFSATPDFRFSLQPGQVVALPPGAIAKQSIPIYFSCTIHPWMRGVIRYDGGS